MTSEHKYLLPEHFNGTIDVMSYITHFELLSSLQNWLKPVVDATTGNPVLDGSGNPTYTDKRHQIFPLRLRGSAIEFYQSLDNATKGNYTLLKAEFQRQYLEPPEFFRSALTKRTQGSGEKVSEFLADLKLLASKAYPTGSVDVRNHVVLQAFLDGIFNPHVRIELRKQKPADIPAALEQAIHLDAVYRLENSALPVSTSTFVSGQIATRSRPTNRKKDFRPASPGNNNSFSRPKNYRKTPSPGNYRRSSQDRGSSSDRRSQSRSPSSGRSHSSEARRVRFSGPTVCSGCHREGHLKKDCKNCWNCGSSRHLRRDRPKNRSSRH